MGNLPAAPFGRPPGSSSDRAPSSCPSVTQGSPWICFAAWATRGVARTCLKRTRGFRRVTAGQSWLRGSVHVGVGPALSGQVNDRHPVPTLQCRSCFRVRVQGDTRDGGPCPCIRRGETVARRHRAPHCSADPTFRVQRTGFRQSRCDRSTILARARFQPSEPSPSAR